MATKWVAAGGYTAVGLFLIVSPWFLISDPLTSPFSLLQYVGGSLFIALALGTVGEFKPLIKDQRGRVLAAINFGIGFIGFIGHFLF